MKKLSGLLSIIVLLTITLSVNAQNGNRVKQNCCDKITDLTDQQKQNMQNLEKEHQVNMTALRTDRRNASASDKARLGEEMKLAKASHRNDVLNLLDKDQKNQYLAMHDNDGKQVNRNKKGKGSACGNKGQGVKKGNGKGQGKSGNCGGKGRSGSGKGKNRTS